MSVILNSYSDPWKWRKKGCFQKDFSVKSLVDFQYNGEGTIPGRDVEMERLQCEEYYNVPHQFNEPTVPIFSCKFSQMPSYSNIVASADENGFVSVHNVNKFGKVQTCIQTHNNAVFDLTWVPNDSKFLTLSGDHTAKLWDCGESEIKLISVFRGHNKSVKTADFRPNDSAIFATGSRDGAIMVWDSRSQTKASPNLYKPDQVILRATADQVKTNKRASFASVTAVVYQDENSLVCAGSSDPYIRVWDMRKTYSVHKAAEPKNRMKAKRDGFCDLKLSPERTKLYASSLNSSICCFNLNSCSSVPIAEFRGHRNGSFYVKTCVSRDGRYLLSGSSDKLLYAWRTKEGERGTGPCSPFLTYDGHVAEVTGVDINQMGYTTVVSCADDGTLRKWRPVFSNENTESKEAEGITCNLEALNITEERKESRTFTEDVDSWTESSAAVEENWQNTLDAASSQDEPETSVEKEVVNPAVFMTPPSKSAFAESTSSKRKIRETSPSLEVFPHPKRPVLSPKKGNLEDQMYLSPTSNLPNYILDGTGPHHRCSRSLQKENIDWLTKIRRSSQSVDKIRERPASVEKRSEGRSRKFESRTSSSSKKRTSRRTLLEYYKKSSKGIDESSQKSG